MRERIVATHRPWSNARILDLDVSVKSGIVSFIVQLKAKKVKTKINWDSSRLLGYGSVVAFCTDNTPVMLGTITVRDRNLLDSNDGPKIGVSFDTHGEHFKDALNAFVLNSSRIDDGTVQSLSSAMNEALLTTSLAESFTLIEVSSSFATYQPILKSLQKMTEFRLRKNCALKLMLDQKHCLTFYQLVFLCQTTTFVKAILLT
jgi:hypothetical protein